MHISLITPAAKRSLSGNRVTALRWARLLDELGHRVRVDECWRAGDNSDLMIAIHAYRSADAIAQFRDRHPHRPLVVLLAGTDVYRFQKTHPQPTQRSMALADRLVGLHDEVAADIPSAYRARLVVIHQSAEPLPRRRQVRTRSFDVCVIGHLREEKDPLRAALAARRMPSASRLRVWQLGRAHDADWERAANAEMQCNPRYHWLGEQPRWRVRQRMASSHAMVISSIMEGGANVVSEAVVAGLPVFASDIAGNRGLLGRQHPAYFRTRDECDLSALLWRAEREPAYLNAIAAAGALRAPLFSPQREREAWGGLINALTAQS